MHTTHRSSRAARYVAILIGTGLLVAACGGDDAAEPAADTIADTPAETSADTTADDTETTPTTAATTVPDSTAPTEATDEDVFPITIEHKYGDTTIDAEPLRVVSVGFAEHDGLLALGVIPVGVRDWYGEMPYATWPWAQDELGQAQPEVIAAAALNFEQIAAMEPDLILGINSGMTEEDYSKLSAIAPTIAQPGEYPDYATPLDEALAITGRAVGRSAEASQVLADLEAEFAAAREANPEFQGQTAVVAFTFEDNPGGYASGDVRSQVMTDLGFVIPPEFDELAGDAFYFSVSAEELSTLDQDVIVWVVSDEAGYEAVRGEPLRPSLTAYAEGREVLADPLLSGAFSHASPLSLEFVLEELVPELALAVDGDPSTVVPSAASLEDDPGGDLTADEQAASDAWALVFDSSVPFAEKEPHLEDAAALAGTVESYETAGSAMGGISLVPTAVALDGDHATITYDVMFGDAAAYTALEGEMDMLAGVWVVSRDEFCSFMASARNNCPA